jgi:GDP-L-fucose synthase
MSVLIAGATGLAGSAIAREFVALGEEVISVSRSTVDLTDLEATRNYFKLKRPSLVIDAAAKVGGIGANNSRPVNFLLENLKIQNNLMQASFEVGVEKFVFLGSSCIYPRDCLQPIKEEYLMTGPLEKSNSAYAIAKIAGIELINSYRKEYGLPWISLMPTNLYGPRDNFDIRTSHVLPALVRKFVEAQAAGKSSITLWGSGSPLREFLHTDDLAAAVVMTSQKFDGSIHLNIGTGQDISIKDLAFLIADLTGFGGDIEWDTSKPDGTPRKVLDVSRVMSLGCRPTIRLSEGIASTIEWFKFATRSGEARL